MRMNSARIMPAAKCPAVLPKDSAPLRMLLLLFCSASVPSFRYWSIWAAVRCRGPSASQTWIFWIPVERLAPELGEAGHQLPAHEGQGAANHADEAQDGDGDGEPVGDAVPPEPVLHR